MNKRNNLNSSSLNDDSEHKIFSARIQDAINLADKNNRPYFVGFLDEVQAAIAFDIANKLKCNYHFWGGYKDALRVFFAAYPEDFTPDCNSFPVVALCMSFNINNTRDKLSHRDFLGALMALGINRDAIGDILVAENICVVFCKNNIADFIKLNLSRISKTKIKFIDPYGIELPISNTFETIYKTVASPRLDSVVAAVINSSRSSAAALIREKKVNVNYRQVDSLSGIICCGDILSVSGIGKFIIDQLGPMTRKNRIKLLARKYK